MDPRPIRNFSSLPPTKLCTFWLQSPDACLKGDACSFAHGKAELHLAIESLVGKFTVIHHVYSADTVPGRMSFDDFCFKVSRCQMCKHVHTQESKLTSHERGRESISPHWIQAKSALAALHLKVKWEESVKLGRLMLNDDETRSYTVCQLRSCANTSLKLEIAKKARNQFCRSNEQSRALIALCIGQLSLILHTGLLCTFAHSAEEMQ